MRGIIENFDLLAIAVLALLLGAANLPQITSEIVRTAVDHAPPRIRILPVSSPEGGFVCYR